MFIETLNKVKYKFDLKSYDFTTPYFIKLITQNYSETSRVCDKKERKLIKTKNMFSSHSENN